jgi:hypothetical protein
MSILNKIDSHRKRQLPFYRGKHDNQKHHYSGTTWYKLYRYKYQKSIELKLN